MPDSFAICLASGEQDTRLYDFFSYLCAPKCFSKKKNTVESKYRDETTKNYKIDHQS